MQSNIKFMINSDDGFYNLLGKYLSKRYIVNETGINVWDDNDNYWIVLTLDTGVLGFSSMKIKNNIAQINILYVIPEHRHKLIGSKILEAVVLNCINNKLSKIVVTSTVQGLQLYKKYGFTEVGKKGKYFKLMRRCD